MIDLPSMPDDSRVTHLVYLLLLQTRRARLRGKLLNPRRERRIYRIVPEEEGTRLRPQANNFLVDLRVHADVQGVVAPTPAEHDGRVLVLARFRQICIRCSAARRWNC